MAPQTKEKNSRGKRVRARWEVLHVFEGQDSHCGRSNETKCGDVWSDPPSKGTHSAPVQGILTPEGPLRGCRGCVGLRLENSASC